MENLMKVVFTIVFITNTVFSQDIVKSKFEIGINAFNYTAVSIPVINHAEQHFYSNFLNGIIFKIHSHKNSLRFAVDYANYFKDINAENNFDADTLNSFNRYKNGIISVGIEREFVNRKFFQAYYGTDVGLFIAESSGNYASQTGLTSFSVEKIQTGIGISPFLGIRFQIKNLAFSCEPSVTLLSYKEKENRNHFSPQAKNEMVPTFNFNLRPNIINRFSISFVF